MNAWVLWGQRHSLLKKEADLAVLRDEEKTARKEGSTAVRRTRAARAPGVNQFGQGQLCIL